MPQGKRHIDILRHAWFTFKTLLCTGAQTSLSTWIAWPCWRATWKFAVKGGHQIKPSNLQSFGGLEGLPMSYLRPKRVSLVCAPLTQDLWPVIQTKRLQLEKRHTHSTYAKSLYIHLHKVSVLSCDFDHVPNMYPPSVGLRHGELYVVASTDDSDLCHKGHIGSCHLHGHQKIIPKKVIMESHDVPDAPHFLPFNLRT